MTLDLFQLGVSDITTKRSHNDDMAEQLLPDDSSVEIETFLWSISCKPIPFFAFQPVAWKEAKRQYDKSGVWPLYQAFGREPCPMRRRVNRDAVEIGTEEDCQSKDTFCNGPLPSGVSFLFAMRAFTKNTQLGGTDTTFTKFGTKPAAPIITNVKAGMSGKQLTVQVKDPVNYSEQVRVEIKVMKDNILISGKNFTSKTFKDSFIEYTPIALKPFTAYQVSAVAILEDGDLMLKSDTSFKEAKTVWTILIIVIVLIIISILSIAIAILLVMKYRPDVFRNVCKCSKDKKPKVNQQSSEQNPIVAVKQLENVPITSIPITLSDFESEFHRMSRDSNLEFARQFDDLKDVGVEEAKSEAKRQENKMKNRCIKQQHQRTFSIICTKSILV